MRRRRETANRASSRWASAALTTLAGTLAALGLAGCANHAGKLPNNNGDPLFGPGQGGAPPPPGRSSANVQQVPSAQATNPLSNASLATSLPGSRPLAITPAGFSAATTSTPIPRRQEPIVQSVPRDGTVPRDVPAASPTSSSASNATQNPLQEQLRARNVLWQKADDVADGVKFACIVASRHNPDVTHFYEATARDYTSAVQAVLQQIDRSR